MSYMVKEVANMTGITVRTLHHYDDIGLLRPASTSPAGYRLYAEEDLHRLQQILFLKEIGFDLRQIKNILDHPGFDRTQALQSHRKLLLARKRRLEAIIRTVDETLASWNGGMNMAKEEMFRAFDMSEVEKHMNEYEAEAKERYGSAIVEESMERARGYTANDWSQISVRTSEIYQKVIDGMARGPADAQVQAAVAEWRQLITDNFYDCTLEIFRGLADLYVDDERFTANIDKHQEGLARFLREAMIVYCDNAKS